MQHLRAVCRRYRVWILLTATLLLCQRVWLSGGKVERVLSVPDGYEFLRLHDSVVYLCKPDKAPTDWSQAVQYVRRPGHNLPIPLMTSSPAASWAMSAVFAMPVLGGSVREVPSSSLESIDPAQLITAGADTYRVEFRKASRVEGLPTPSTGTANGTNGTDRSDASASGSVAAVPPSSPHTIVYRQVAEEWTALLYPLSPSGSPKSAVLTYPMGFIPTTMYVSGSRNYMRERVTVSEGVVYWVREFPDERVDTISTDGKSVENTVSRYRTAIMAAPLQGGTARKLFDGLSDTTFLLPSQDGALCWKGDTLWRLRMDHAPLRILAGVKPVNVTEWNGHLFWAEVRGAGSDKRIALMQANADGSAPRLLLNTSREIGDFDFMRYGTFYARPTAHRNGLYCLLLERDTRHPDSTTAPDLYRLKLSPKPALERLCALPQEGIKCWFDGDFMYCLALENRWSDFSLHTDSKPATPHSVFYRYRLPAE